MSRFLTKTVSGLTPYIPGEQPASHSLLKLNTNEHALPLSVQHLHQLNEALMKQKQANEIKFDDFIVTPMGFLPKTLSTILSWFS